MSDRRYEDDWYGDEDEGIDFDAYEIQRFRRRYGFDTEILQPTIEKVFD